MSSLLELEPTPGEAVSDAPCRTGVVATLEEFASLEQSWRSLGREIGGPIEQFDWAATCAATLDPGSLQVATVVRGDELAAVAPLAVKRMHGVRRQVMLGVDEHHEPMDILARDPQALRRLAESLARDPRPSIFGRLPGESPAIEALKQAFRGRALVLQRPQAAFPYISLDASWTEPERHSSSRRRSDLRRARRRAEEFGDVTFEALTPRPEELDALLDEAFDVERRSWKGETGTAVACDAGDAAFCREYAHAACRQGILRLCFLRIDGRATAMQLAMVQGGGFWLLKIGYDAEFARCSPGMLLLCGSIAEAARAGLKTFEFLGQTEPWIEVWTQRQRQSVSLRVFPYNLAGAAALAADVSVKLAESAADRGRRFAGSMRGAVKTCAKPLLKLASRNYIAGDTLEDALRVRQRLCRQGLFSSIGFWDTASFSAQQVADQYLAGLDALVGDEQGTYLSIKLPALRFSSELLANVAQKAVATKRRIHCDSHGPEVADRSRALVEEALAAAPGVDISYTLPGRWRRSLDDAKWATERGLYVRVVKGEWPDPADPDRDLRGGFLEVIDQLAGRSQRVGVATHDPPLAAEAIRRLRTAGTPCDLELLYGLPTQASIRQARQLGVDVRVYVPYGEAYMPYALSQVKRKPRILVWLLKDMVASLFRGKNDV